MGLLLHHPFSSRSGQSSVLVQASHSGPQNPTNLRTVSVYRSSTYQSVFCVILLPHPTTATMCSHCFQHINILHSPERQPSEVPSIRILWKSIPAAGCLTGGCLFPGARRMGGGCVPGLPVTGPSSTSFSLSWSCLENTPIFLQSQSLNQDSSNLNVLMNYLGILLKCRFCWNGSGSEPKALHFLKVPQWY